MAIGSDALIDFFGTQDDLTNTAGTVADTAFSVAADLDNWTNDDDAAFASFVLEWQYASGSLVEPYINLFAQLLNIEGANDTPVPDASALMHYLGTFPIDAGLATGTYMYSVIPWVRLPNLYTSQLYSFVIENQTGVTIDDDPVWSLFVTPQAPGPHA